ncbi:MAG: homoserine kinase [Actinomycetota bacterium]
MNAFVVRCPATVANLGPGFDCFGLAIDVHGEFEVDPAAPPSVSVEGEGSEDVPRDASNLVLRAAHRVAREAGKRLPSFALRCVNGIPVERGLGSSAAAVVAGVVIADRLLGTDLGADRMLEVAAAEEGHPDNVAACLRGGLVVAFRSGDRWQAYRLDPSPELRPVLLIPEKVRVPTDQARRALPAEVPLADAAFNASRAALAAVAFTSDPSLLAVALEDRLHQAHPLGLAPAAQRAFDELRRAGVPVCVAGSGPTLLAFEIAGTHVPELGGGWRALRPAVNTSGAVVEDR